MAGPLDPSFSVAAEGLPGPSDPTLDESHLSETPWERFDGRAIRKQHGLGIIFFSSGGYESILTAGSNSWSSVNDRY